MATTITITCDGLVVTTAVLAAARYDMQPQALRHSLDRAGIKPVGHLDRRTPLYVATAVDRHLASRPHRPIDLSSATSG